jgi:hypothetical protein
MKNIHKEIFLYDRVDDFKDIFESDSLFIGQALHQISENDSFFIFTYLAENKLLDGFIDFDFLSLINKNEAYNVAEFIFQMNLLKVNDEILEACILGNHYLTLQSICEYNNISFKSIDEYTFVRAAEENSFESLKFLVEGSYIDFTLDNHSLIVSACYSDYNDLIKFFLTYYEQKFIPIPFEAFEGLLESESECLAEALKLKTTTLELQQKAFFYSLSNSTNCLFYFTHLDPDLLVNDKSFVEAMLCDVHSIIPYIVECKNIDINHNYLGVLGFAIYENDYDLLDSIIKHPSFSSYYLNQDIITQAMEYADFAIFSILWEIYISERYDEDEFQYYFESIHEKLSSIKNVNTFKTVYLHKAIQKHLTDSDCLIDFVSDTVSCFEAFEYLVVQEKILEHPFLTTDNKISEIFNNVIQSNRNEKTLQFFLNNNDYIFNNEDFHNAITSRNNNHNIETLLNDKRIKNLGSLDNELLHAISYTDEKTFLSLYNHKQVNIPELEKMNILQRIIYSNWDKAFFEIINTDIYQNSCLNNAFYQSLTTTRPEINAFLLKDKRVTDINQCELGFTLKSVYGVIHSANHAYKDILASLLKDPRLDVSVNDYYILFKLVTNHHHELFTSFYNLDKNIPSKIISDLFYISISNSRNSNIADILYKSKDTINFTEGREDIYLKLKNNSDKCSHILLDLINDYPITDLDVKLRIFMDRYHEQEKNIKKIVRKMFFDKELNKHLKEKCKSYYDKYTKTHTQNSIKGF